MNPSTDNPSASAPGLSRRRFLGGAGATLGALTLAPLFAAPAKPVPAPPTSRPRGIDPFAIEGDAIVIPAGSYHPGDRRVTVTQRAALQIAPADVVTIRDEKLLLSADKPGGFFTGTKLKGTLAKNIGAFHSLIEESVTLRDASGRTLRRGEDYLVSARFALLGIGPKATVTTQTPVFATYSFYTQRIDAIAVDATGMPFLVPGTARLYSPDIPPVSRGATAIATVYRPFRGVSLAPEHVFPITAAAATAPTVTNRGRVPKTLRKLQSGEPATIVCWGDSIAVGADVEPAEAWANLVRVTLREQFPRANVIHKNHSIGGSKTAQWLHNGDFPGLPKKDPQKCRFEHILAEKPDLVIMEFINDIVFPEDVLQRTYASIHEQFSRRGSEWLIVTPSQKIPENFDLAEMTDGQPRLLDNFLRRFAREHGCALADAAARWKHLHREGIPYFSLFNNAYNHPNAFGHRLFVEEIMKCFRA